MTEIQFQAEKRYQVTMALARVMREKGLLTLEEYADFDTKMLEKYRPLLGSLWADASLTISGSRVIDGIRKDVMICEI